MCPDSFDPSTPRPEHVAVVRAVLDANALVTAATDGAAFHQSLAPNDDGLNVRASERGAAETMRVHGPLQGCGVNVKVNP